MDFPEPPYSDPGPSLARGLDPPSDDEDNEGDEVLDDAVIAARHAPFEECERHGYGLTPSAMRVLAGA